jgi:uncharacterized protein (UPF0371 family)
MVQFTPTGFDRKDKASPPAKPHVIAVAVSAHYRLKASRCLGKVNDNLAAAKMNPTSVLARSDEKRFSVDGIPIDTSSLDVP